MTNPEPRYRSDDEIRLDFSAHALLDTTNEVQTFEEFGMLTPGRETRQMDDLIESYQTSKEHLRLHDFEQSLYPREIMRKAEREGIMPKCIFLPC